MMPNKLQPRRGNASKRRPRGSTLSRQIRLPHTEVKSFSQGANGQAVYDGVAGQYVYDLTAVTQGVSGAQRVGDQLYPVKLTFRACIYNNIGATSNSAVNWRFFIFEYKADSSVAAKPIISDLLQTNPANGGGTYGSFSNYDIDYDRMYRILWDSGLVLTEGNHNLAATSSNSYGERKLVQVSVKLSRDRKIDFFTGTATGFNHIFLLVTTDSGTLATNPLITWSSEFRYTDD